ncbi:MAG: hypothetical protein ABIQ52_21565 [Vicinamibacterales bacterium]
MMRLLMMVLGLAVVPQPVALPVVHVVKTFPSLSGPNSADAGSTSADLSAAVSPKYLVTFINAGMQVKRKTDGGDMQPPRTQMQFWTAALENAGEKVQGKPYDPRISYDPMAARWFAASNENINGLSHVLLFAASQDDDPTHPWKAVRYEVPMLIDNCKLALDRYGFYTTSLGATRDPLAEVKTPVIAIPKADLLWTGTAKPSLEHVNLFEVTGVPRMSDRKYNGNEGMVPAYDWDAGKARTAPMYYVNRFRKEVDGETFLQIRTLTWDSPTKATLSGPVEIGLGEHYAVQPTTMAVQPPAGEGLLSPGIRPGEARIVNAVVRNGRLYTIAAAQMGARAGAFWVEIELATMKLLQHGKLADPALDILFPSINVDRNGNIGLAMSATSATVYPSIYVTGRLKGDPPGTLRPLVRAVEGKYVHLRKTTDLQKPEQNESWSDFSTVILDSKDQSTFWTLQEATTNPTLPQEQNADRFGTHWVAWKVGK